MLIVICEDTTRDMENITALCDRFAQAHGYAIHTLQYAGADAMLSDPAARGADLLLLDITMPDSEGTMAEGAGVALARRMRAEGFTGGIVFTTTSDDYYREGYEVGAMHYLRKPLTYETLSEALLRALTVIKAPERTISIPVDRVQLSIPQQDILYAEVYGRETLLVTHTEQYRTLLPLKRIQHLLDEQIFLRCYRSYIINMDHVRAMEDDHFLMTNGARVPISIRNRSTLKESFYAYRLSRKRAQRSNNPS